MALRCIVATPTRELFSGDIYYANVPGVEGSYGVLPGHEMLVATNKSGGILTINLDAEGREKKQFILFEGATQVYQDSVNVLGRFGKCVDDIDVDEIKQKQEALRAKLEELEKSEADQDKIAARTSRKKLEWYQMQLDYVEGK